MQHAKQQKTKQQKHRKGTDTRNKHANYAKAQHVSVRLESGQTYTDMQVERTYMQAPLTRIYKLAHQT